MAGVYVPVDGPSTALAVSELAGTRKNRRAILEYFKKNRDAPPQEKPQPFADDTKRLLRPEDMSTANETTSGTEGDASTNNGYWQRFTEVARKKAWYNSASSGDENSDADGEPDKQKKDKIQFLSRRNARSSNSTMQNVLKRKVYVSSARAEELEQLQQEAQKAGSEDPGHTSPDSSQSQEDAGKDSLTNTKASEAIDTRIPILLLGFTEQQVERIQMILSEQYYCRAETFVERDWVSLIKSSAQSFTIEDPEQPPDTTKKTKRFLPKPKKKSNPPQIVAIRFSEAEVSEFQWCSISAHFMASRIVAPVVDTAEEHRPDVHEALGSFMQETWPVHSNVESFCQFCMRDVPGMLRLRSVIQEDVAGRIQHLGKVNYLWHGAKRVPVSFVPFGVSAVNFLGLSRLVAKILLKVGMLKDPATKKAGLLLAGQSYAKVFVLDNLGDLYQLTAAGTVVASLSSALIMGEGLLAAVGALSVSDFALLGSASIVTGAVAAVGAALTRPEMVQSLCLLIATLQTLWCVFPQTRRQDASASGEEMTPEQRETAEQLARLTLLPPDGGPAAASAGPSVPTTETAVCEADVSNTLKLMLESDHDSGVYLECPGASAGGVSAPASSRR
eukprot:jgi/Ulvmu1/616/UM001_0624.1